MKTRELDRKLKEEIALREKAEARCVEFRKKLRALSGDSNASPQEQVTASHRENNTDAKPLCPPNDNTVDQDYNNSQSQDEVTPSGASKVLSNDVVSSFGAVPTKDGKLAYPPYKPNVSTVGETSNSSSASNDPQPVNSVPKGHPVGPSAMLKVASQTSACKPFPLVGDKPPTVTNSVASVVSPTRAASGPGMDQRSTIQSDATSINNLEPRVMHGRSLSNESVHMELEGNIQAKTDNMVKIDISMPPNRTRTTTGAAPRRPDPSSVPQHQVKQATPPQTPQQRPLPVSRAVTAPPTPAPAPAHSRGASLCDFDPLHPTPTPIVESNIWPVISFPSNLSFGTVPVSATGAYLNSSNLQTYTPTEALTQDQFNQGATIADTPYMVPIAFGIAASDQTATQQQVASSFQMHQPLVLQQPIMFQSVQGGGQQWIATPQQNAQTSSQHYFQQPGFVQQQQMPPPSNPFDPFST